jgi:hypothetical protein
MVSLLLAAAALAANPAPQGQTLTGVVRDAAGQPVPRATVFVRTAGPRQGVGVL